MRKKLIATLIITTSLFMGQITQAALPVSVDGQKLPSLAPMLKHTIPGVVNIATKGETRVKNNPMFNDPFFRFFFGLPNAPRKHRADSLGSGVIVDAKKGIILTNAHVIKHAKQITVTLDNGKQYEAKQIGKDPDSDIAVIQIEAKDLTALPLADSDELQRGDFVVAIGSPFGLMQTVTSGIVSALGRSGLGIEGYEDFIQTDASINPGNSGGALVNLNGHLVGINTAILAPSGGNVGIGFAIPINMARTIMEQILKHGDVKRGVLGVSIQDLTPDLAESLGAGADQGAVVSQVEPNSGAAKAGIQTGDIITAVNGKNVVSGADLRNKVGLQRVGSSVELTFMREGNAKTVTATLNSPEELNSYGKSLHPSLEGAELSNKVDGSGDTSKAVEVISVEQGSEAWHNNLREGDVIVAVVVAKKRYIIKNINQLSEVLKRARGHFILNVRRGNSSFFLLVKQKN